MKVSATRRILGGVGLLLALAIVGACSNPESVYAGVISTVTDAQLCLQVGPAPDGSMDERCLQVDDSADVAGIGVGDRVQIHAREGHLRSVSVF